MYSHNFAQPHELRPYWSAPAQHCSLFRDQSRWLRTSNFHKEKTELVIPKATKISKNHIHFGMKMWFRVDTRNSVWQWHLRQQTSNIYKLCRFNWSSRKYCWIVWDYPWPFWNFSRKSGLWKWVKENLKLLMRSRKTSQVFAGKNMLVASPQGPSTDKCGTKSPRLRWRRLAYVSMKCGCTGMT